MKPTCSPCMIRQRHANNAQRGHCCSFITTTQWGFFSFPLLVPQTIRHYCVGVDLARVVLSYSKGFSVFGENSQSIVSGLGAAWSRVRAETTFTCSNLLVNSFLGEPVWPSGKALVRLVRGGASVRIRFGSPLSSEVVVCGCCVVTLSLTIYKTLKCGSHRCPS